MNMNKITVFLKSSKIHFIHRNMLIGWFVVESYNYMCDLTFSKCCYWWLSLLRSNIVLLGE